jgi:hypothetical protein
LVAERLRKIAILRKSSWAAEQLRKISILRQSFPGG